MLIACDDAPTRTATVDALAALGCEAIETADAEFALSVLRARPDIRALVVAAQQIGTLTGYELARAAQRERPSIRHVVIVGARPPERGELPTSAHFLPRPLNISALLAVLQAPPDGPRGPAAG